MDIEKMQRHWMKAAETIFLRNVAGYTTKDEITNTVIRNEIHILFLKF
jgi:hypothetical protein